MKRDFDTLPLDLGSELIVDNFAGGGGASTGIERAFGRPVDIAINHDSEALAMHAANHPHTAHYCESVFDVDPVAITGNQPVGLVWLSPDCFPAGTMILTDRGYRAIEFIREGDMVLTHTGRYRRVYATMSAAKPVREVDIQGVPTIRVTSEHPFYARSMLNVWDNARRRYVRTLRDATWISARDLRAGAAEMNAAGGDRHFCATPCLFPALAVPKVGGRGLDIDERLMWLAGRYVGDGWSRLTDDRAELVITCGKREAAELELVLNVWPRQGNRAGAGEIAWHQRETKTAYQFSTNHRGLVEWLRGEFGHGGAEKSLPAWALGCADNLRRALLDGYVSADGSNLIVRGVDISETVTISRALAFSTKSLAESLGYTAQVFEPRQNSTVIEGRSVNAQPYYLVRWRANPQRTQTVRDALHNWSRVQRVSDEVGTSIVFNISVEDDESYIADGIVVHNCKHFSKAKGGKPVSKKIRGLAWIALRWAATVKPRVIMLENVEEFVTWGPLGTDGRPCQKNRGRTFRSFVNALQRQGYTVDYRELRACDFGAPTIRKRFFLVARRDGLPIAWPAPTHGDPKTAAVRAGKLAPWRTAADCIDWSIPCPSIFERERPLKDATMRRIARGIMKFVVNSADPFIVRTAHGDVSPTGVRRWGVGEHARDAPLPTVTGSNDFAVVVPTVMHITHQGDDRTRPADAPLATITTAKRGEQALVAATLVKHNFGDTPCQAADAPLHTVTTQSNRFGVVAATLVQTGYSERPGQAPRAPGLDKPLGTVVAGGAKHAVVEAFLAKHYGGHESPGAPLDKPASTITTQDHHHLVTAQLVGCSGRAAQSRPRDVGEPLATVTAKADTTLAVSHLVKLRGTCRDGVRADEPLHTISAGGMHHAEVRAFLIKYYGNEKDGFSPTEPLHTVPTHDRFGLVTIHGEDYAIVDIGMRMLTPRELARAQGFPDSYILDPLVEKPGRRTMHRTRKGPHAPVVWKRAPLSKSAQVRMIGNSVCPDLAAALVRANFAHEAKLRRAVA